MLYNVSVQFIILIYQSIIIILINIFIFSIKICIRVIHFIIKFIVLVFINFFEYTNIPRSILNVILDGKGCDFNIKVRK